jgi:hypothetical protein
MTDDKMRKRLKEIEQEAKNDYIDEIDWNHIIDIIRQSDNLHEYYTLQGLNCYDKEYTCGDCVPPTMVDEYNDMMKLLNSKDTQSVMEFVAFWRHFKGDQSLDDLGLGNTFSLYEKHIWDEIMEL